MLNTDYRTYKILIFTSPVCAGLIIAMAKYDDEYRVFIDKAICSGIFLVFLSLFLFTSL